MKKFIFIIIILCFFTRLYGFSILDLYPDALSSSLNGAGDLIIKDSYAVYNNPANLIFLFQNELTLDYMYFVEDINRATMTYAWKTDNNIPYCIDLSYMSLGSIPQFSILSGAGDYVIQQLGNLNDWYLNTGFSSSRDFTLFDNSFIVGARAQLLVNHLDKSYYGLLLNSGIIYYPDYQGLAFSLVLNNLGLVDNLDFAAPLKLKIGVGYTVKNLETEINYEIYTTSLLRFGIRWTIFSPVKLLFGYEFNFDNTLEDNINLGIELDFSGFSIYYSVVPKSLLGTYQYFSLKKLF